MFEQAREHMKDYFDFLDTLDCYIGTQEWMIEEIYAFENNPKRQIAALVCQNITEKLVYQAPYIRILYVLSGSVELYIDNKCHRYSAGCLIMANEWTKMDYQQMEPNVEVVNFLFKKEYFSDKLLSLLTLDSLMYRFFLENVKSEVKKSNYFVFQFEPRQDVHFFAMLLLKQVVKMCYEHNQITFSAFILFVTEIGSHANQYLQLKDSALSSSILIYEILEDIKEHYQTITLPYLAEKYYFHANYLSTLIKQETGQNFSELLLQCRLEHACLYLTETTMTVQEILEKIGYQDKTYFYKLFKRHYGITPRQYRKNALVSEQR